MERKEWGEMTISHSEMKIPSKESWGILKRVQAQLTEKGLSIHPIESTVLVVTIEQALKQYKDDKDYSEDWLVGLLVLAVESEKKREGEK